VGCHWCDVKESWNAELHPSSINQIVSNAKNIQKQLWVTIDVGYDAIDPDA
jgi:organic radical activating enzyme